MRTLLSTPAGVALVAPTKGWWPQQEPASSCPLTCPALGQRAGSVLRAGLAFPGCVQGRQAVHNEPAAGQACSCLARVCPSSGRRVSPGRSAARVARAPLLPHPDRGCHCALVEPRRPRGGCGVCEKPLGRGKTALRYFVRGFSPALRVIRLNHTPGRAGVSPQPSWAAAARLQQRT